MEQNGHRAVSVGKDGETRVWGLPGHTKAPEGFKTPSGAIVGLIQIVSCPVAGCCNDHLSLKG